MTALTTDEQASLTAGAAMWATAAIPHAGIPALHFADGPMGIASGRVDERDVSVLTPAPIALGASWDRDLVGRVGACVGREAVRKRVDVVLAPNVNLARSPLAGRAFEYFSEDPLLTGTLGAAWATGVQSTGTAAVAKHLVCNDSETDRNTVDVRIEERALREVYLLPFELAATAGVAGIMTAYNRVNGVWSSEQTHVIDIVKREWGFAGFLVSDWFGTHSTQGAATAGLDLEMPGPARFLGTATAEAVQDGRVSADRLRDAADRLTRTARRFGGAKATAGDRRDDDALLVEAAAAGFALVRNQDDLLPLAATGRIAVIGPNATNPCFQGGTFAKIALRPDAPTPLESIRARFRDATIVHASGVDPQPRLPALPAVPARDLGDGLSRGLTIDYFADAAMDGDPVGSETRDTNSLVWFVGVHDLGVFDRPAGIRATGIYTPRWSGPHHVHLGGTGAVRLAVDGVEVLRRDDPVAASDVMGRLKSGVADVATIGLAAGVPVKIAIEFRYDVARAHGLWYGIREPDSADAMLARAVEAAQGADAVILMVGETADASVESRDRTSTALAPEQIRLIEAVTAANPRTAIVANVGHAFSTEWDARCAALLLAWYPGEGFGPALADVLAGDREPGGRLPVTIACADGDYPALALSPDGDGRLAYTEGCGIGYRGFAVPPAYAFGSGFGYARFQIADARDEGNGTISVDLRNVSDRAGGEVVQVYRAVPEPTLVGFAKLRLAPGERRRLSIPIEPRLLRIWRDGWTMPTAPVELHVGRSSADCPLLVSFQARRQDRQERE